MRNTSQLKSWAEDLFDWAMEEEYAIQYRSNLGKLINTFSETISNYKSKRAIKVLRNNLTDALDLYARHVNSVNGEYCEEWYARGSRIKSRRDAKQRAFENAVYRGGK